MARIPLPYSTNNELARLLTLEQARRVTKSSGGSKPSIKELEQEIADYCGITRDTVNMIKRGKNQPSLHVALKICEYLGKSIEDVFKLSGNPDYKG